MQRKAIGVVHELFIVVHQRRLHPDAMLASLDFLLLADDFNATIVFATSTDVD